MARETGSGKTQQRVIDELNKKLLEVSLNAISKATGVGVSALHRYQRGIGEPTTATLEKLAKYFKKPVWWLREEILFDNSQREKASVRFWAAVENILRRGEISIADRDDLCTMQEEFAIIMGDARMFEKLLSREESNRKTLVNKRMTQEYKELIKEIDTIAGGFISDEPPKKE